MTTPSNSRLLSSSVSSNWTKGSSDYSPTSTSTPFATPATRATSIAPSTCSRSGPGNRRAKQLLLSSASSIDGTRHDDMQASPTPIGSRSGTPASREGSGIASDAGAKPNLRLKGRTAQSPSTLSPAATDATTSKATTCASSELPKDAEDFFARAQAMGLRLTREDYERTRAGITAFLKAERIPSASSAAASTSKPASGDSKANGMEAGPQALSHSPIATAGKASGAPSLLGASAPLNPTSTQAGPSSTALSRTGGPSWTRNASSPMLSFFTAVVAPTLLPGSAKVRASLDQIGSAEEKRRRRIKKLRLREKRERELQERLAGQDNSQTPNSSLMLQSSPEGTFQTPPAAQHGSTKDKNSSSGQHRKRVGLGLGLDFDDSDGNPGSLPSTPPEPHQSSFNKRKSRGRTVSFDTSSPGGSTAQPMRHCASLDDLSRRAWVSPHGKLHLLRSAVDPDGVFPTPEMEADDSGVFFEGDEAGTAIVTGVPADGWGAKHRRESSSNLSGTDALDCRMVRLSFLDHVMAQQTSPRRIYKEAKLKQKAELERKLALEREQAEQAALQIAELAAKAELAEVEAAKAADAANAIKASNSDYALASVSTPCAVRRKRLQSGAFGMATPLDASGSRSMRLVTGMKSPRNAHTRMTTREHYDFFMHGISPGQPGFDSLDSICNISNTPGPITFTATWDAEPLSAVRSSQDHGKSANGKALISATPFRSSLFADEVRPELIGVSPSVAGLFHAKSASVQGSHSKLLRSASDGLAVMSPLSGRLIAGAQTRIGDLDFEEDLPAGEEQFEGLSGLGRPVVFNPKRGLLFGTPTASPSGSAARTAAMEATLAQSPAAKGFGFLGASPGRAGRDFLESDGSAMGTRLMFASPRSVLLRAHSGGALDSMASQKERCSSPRPDQGTSKGHKRKASKDGRRSSLSSKKVAVDGFGTISPADVFGSALPRIHGTAVTHVTQPLPEPVKAGSLNPVAEAVLDDAASEAEYTSDIETSARKKHVVGRRARSHSPQSPLKPIEAAGSVLQEGGAFPAVHLDFGASSATASYGRSFPAGELVVASNAGNVNTLQRPQLGAPGPLLSTKKADAKVKASTKATGKTAKAASASKPGAVQVGDVPARNFELMISNNAPSIQDGDELGWDQPDGSRLVKLVSEELQAALESGALEQEPPARYYLLPPGFGNSKAKPSSVSYAGLIGQAIKSSSDMRLSLAEIYTWISTTYPFFEKGDRGWQNSIRHNLSLNKSFMKIEREANMPGKGGWWGIQPGHEERFQNGMYNASAQKAEATKVKASGAKAEPKASSIRNDATTANGDTVRSTSGCEASAEALGQASVSASTAASSGVPAAETGEVKGLKKKVTVGKRKKVVLARPGSAGSSDDSDDGDVPLKLAGSRPSKRAKVLSAKGSTGAMRLPLTESHLQPEAHQLSTTGYDSMTPIRPYSSTYASSVAGSQHSRGAPMLTDSASSPPSSPFTLMPPPTVQMTADHSALKRKLASGQIEGQFGYSTGFSPSPYGMHASPLGSGRSNAYRNMRTSALGGAFSFSGPMHGEVSGGSPLRRSNKGYGNGNLLSGSPKRLWSISSPVSSMRGSAKSSGLHSAMERTGSNENTSLSIGTSEALSKSPNSAARMAALAHSPIRGSPLRHASAAFSGSPGRSVASSTSLQMHLGMGGVGGSSSAFGQALGMGMGMGMGMGNTPGRKTAQARYGSSMSPMRRSLMSSASSQLQAQGVSGSHAMQPPPLQHSGESVQSQQQQPPQHHHLVQQSQRHLQQQHHQPPMGWYLDDPFDVQSGVQHQMDMNLQMGSFGGMMSGHESGAEAATASPLRMMWNTIQAAGGVQAFTSSYHPHHPQQ